MKHSHKNYWCDDDNKNGNDLMLFCLLNVVVVGISFMVNVAYFFSMSSNELISVSGTTFHVCNLKQDKQKWNNIKRVYGK